MATAYDIWLEPPEGLPECAPCDHCPHPLEDHACTGSQSCLEDGCDCAGFDLREAA